MSIGDAVKARLSAWEAEIPAEYHTDDWWAGDAAAGTRREHVEPERLISPV